MRARRALHIYYLFCPAGAMPPPPSRTSHTIPRGLSRALKTPHWGVFAPRYAERGVSTCGYRIELRPLTWLVLCDRCACSGFLFPPQAAVTSAASCSRPRWCTDPQCPGKLQQKNSPTFSVRLYLGALCSGLSRALKTPHWGVFAPRYAERGARAVLVPDGAPVRSVPGNRNKKTPRNFLRGVCFGAPSGTRTQDPLIKRYGILVPYLFLALQIVDFTRFLWDILGLRSLSFPNLPYLSASNLSRT